MSDNQQAQVVQVPVQKKVNSYTYWVDQKNKSRQLPLQQRPQKVQLPKQSTQLQQGRSQWNTAGTWQHKTISLKNVQGQYEEKVHQWVKDNQLKVKINTITIGGECQTIFMRNKKALTYQINGKIQFQTLTLQQQQIQPNTQQADNLSSNSQESSKSKSKAKKSSSKSKQKTMTFQIVDLTDHGDREYKSSSSDPILKKLISEKSQQLLKLLQQILQAYK